MSKPKEVQEFCPESEWNQAPNLREEALHPRVRTVERSLRKPQGIRGIPLWPQVEGCKVSWPVHEQQVVQHAQESTLKVVPFMGDDEPVDQDLLNAEAILADMGKLFEYEKVDPNCVPFACNAYLRHSVPGVVFTMHIGVSNADFMNNKPLGKGLTF